MEGLHEYWLWNLKYKSKCRETSNFHTLKNVVQDTYVYDSR